MRRANSRPSDQRGAAARSGAAVPSLLARIRARPLAAVLTAGVAALAVPAMTDSYAQSQDRANPEGVLRVRPGNVDALNALADRQLAGLLRKLQADPSARPGWDGPQLAMQSLRSHELNPGAVRLLAFDAMLKNDFARSRALADVALRLTRREPLIYLIGIQDAARHNDIPAIMQNYDRALTVAAISRNVLAPSLVTALSEPAIQDAFVPYVRRNPRWMGQFLRYAALNTADPAMVSEVIVRAGGVPVSDEAEATTSALLTRLYETHSFSALRRFVPATARVGGLWTRTDFNPSTSDARYAPATWQLLATSDVDAGWRGEGRLRRLSLSVSPGDVPATVARKLLALTPGDYRVGYRFADVLASDADAQATWSLRCLTDGAPRGAPIWTSAALARIGERAARGFAVVPADCAMQELSLDAVGGSGRQGLSLAADPISFVKVPE